jgi:hypothetical protein
MIVFTSSLSFSDFPCLHGNRYSRTVNEVHTGLWPHACQSVCWFSRPPLELSYLMAPLRRLHITEWQQKCEQ